MRLRSSATLLVMGVLALSAAGQTRELVVLRDTGRAEAGLPVVVAHPNPERFEAALNRGFSARLMRLDRMVQQHLHAQGKGPAPEPVYLVLSRRQGGFPRQGFVLDGRARSATRWIDLPESQRLSGSWGAMDQIFPHELAHIVMARLAKEDAARVPVQTHAVGVRTTPSLAFQEGFGDHAQIMAVDDPGVDPTTAALAKDSYWRRRAEGHLAAYRRELEARISLGTPMRMAFPLWFSNDEQFLRYHGVKANVFARAPAVPARLIEDADPYRAYLLERVLPGSPQDKPRTAVQMVATEGVVSHLIWRWVNSPEIGRKLREAAFYASFGADPRQLDPVDNAYLKIFAVVESSQAGDLPAVVRAYEARFPDEAPWLDALVREALLGKDLPASPNLWIVNPAWQVGTTLFDQWRAVPQPHCFDLNAADAVDLAQNLGVTAPLAEAIQRGTPYGSVSELARVPGVTARLVGRLRSLEYVPARAADDETELANRLRPILLAYVWRALAIWLAATVLSALAICAVEPWGIASTLWRGALASCLGLFAVWLGPAGIKEGMWLALALLVIPTVLWRLRKSVAARVPVRRQLSGVNASLRGVMVWVAALAPAWALTRAWL